MTSEEIKSHCAMFSRNNLTDESFPLWEIAYQLAVGNEQRTKWAPYDFRQDAQNLANSLAASLPGKGDAGGQRGRCLECGHFHRQAGHCGAPIRLWKGYDPSAATWDECGCFSEPPSQNFAEQENSRVWREHAGKLQIELNQAVMDIHTVQGDLAASQGELAAANQHVKVLEENRGAGVAATLRACAASIRYNHMDFASAEKYLLEYAATVERESTKTRPPSPGVTSSLNGPTW